MNLNIPLRNRVAKADQYRSELEYRQAELRLEQLKKQVRIEVRSESDAPDVFRVTSEARFPHEGTESVLRSVTRSFRRTRRGGEVRLEVMPEPPAVSGPGDVVPKP